MALLRQISIVGTHIHPPTGEDYAYDVDCRIAIDLHGLESMHIRGRIARGNASTGFVAMGHVDPGQSFIGREEQVVMDCIELACARLAAPSRGRFLDPLGRPRRAAFARAEMQPAPALMHSLHAAGVRSA